MLSRPTQVQMQMQQECQAVGGEEALANQHWANIFPEQLQESGFTGQLFPGIARRIEQVPAKAQ